MKIIFLLLFTTFIVLLKNQKINAQTSNDSLKRFTINYYSADKLTEISKIDFNETFYIKIDYPAGFERTTFNLYKLDFLSGIPESKYTFSSIMIPYSIDSETKNYVFLSCDIKNDEDMKLNLKMMEKHFTFNKEGNLVLEAKLSNSSTSLPTTSKNLILKIN